METELTIEAQSDYLEKIAKSKPINSIAEIVWNSLDADAKKVSIKFYGNEIGIDKIEITDDGIGFNHATALKTFSSLGGSWKRMAEKTSSGRSLHGKEGHGRFKIFSLGHNVIWNVVYKENENFYEYSIKGSSSRLNKFNVSENILSSKTTTGVNVVITDPVKQYKILDEDLAVAELTSIYAPFLSSYVDTTINVGSKSIDTTDKIKSKKSIDILTNITTDDEVKHTFSLEIFEWNGLNIHELYFCDSNGFPIQKYEKQIRGIGEYGYSGYVKSTYFDYLKLKGEMELIEITDEFAPVLNETLKGLKNYFIEQYRNEQRSVIDKWKEDEVYPYSDSDEKSPVKDAENKVFDILALNINNLVDDFQNTSLKQKKLQFKLLQQAIETNPGNIRKIIEEVINLPRERAAELAELLDYTSLSSIITTSKIISDRIKFTLGFEEIVFDTELKAHLKERTQLHRILADNIWFFGDEFLLSVDDQSLTEVLRKYSSHLDNNIVIDNPVKRLDDSVGIIDLMLSKSVPRTRPDEVEFLIIELKAPKVKIGREEINQIESYAFAVAKDERFRGLKARWEFWVVSSDMDDFAKMKATQRAYPKGTIYQNEPTEENDITIKIRTWSELISENKHRHNFVKNTLNSSISKNDGLDFLKDKYEKMIGSLTTASTGQPDKPSAS